MIKISQTDYVDFIHRSGVPKVSKVKSIYSRPDYHPSFDFYKALREEFSNYCKHKVDRQGLADFPAKQDVKKRARYSKLIAGYLKFLGKKKATWFGPPTAFWTHKELEVKMNPELGLGIGDEKFIIKLYLKEEKLSMSHIKILLWMMDSTLCSGIFHGYRCGLLDVEQGKLHYFKKPELPINELIIGEAETFIRVWEGLQRRSA